MPPILDRVPFKDEHSRQYPVSRLLSAKTPRKNKMWGIPSSFPLDQGQEGACVGFGWAHELGAFPVMYMVNNDYAQRYYRAAQREDRRMGNNFSEGASVLAGAKVAKLNGMISEYRWAFSVDQIIDCLVQRGPVLLGVNWYESMYQTDEQFKVVIEGEQVGGHCIIAFGYQKKYRGEECIALLNSWGPFYGTHGVSYLPVSGLERLMSEDGEACMATDIRR
jgi:hypothetical protein